MTITAGAKRVYVYRIYFPTSDKSYIGQTQDLKRRMSRHLKSNFLVGKALRKYDDWEVYILHTVKTRDEANRIEIEEIRNFNSIAPNGYNLTRGGEGISGYKLSEETKVKMSQSHLGKQSPTKGKNYSEEVKKKMSAAHKGYKHTKETREKIRKARLGYKHSEEAKTKMSLVCKGKKRKPFSKEHLAKMRQANLGKNNSMYGKHHTDEAKAKMAANNRGMKGKHHTEEAKTKMSIARKNFLVKKEEELNESI